MIAHSRVRSTARKLLRASLLLPLSVSHGSVVAIAQRPFERIDLLGDDFADEDEVEDEVEDKVGYEDEVIK